MLAALHDCLEARAQRERGLPGPGPAAQADDADLVVEQEVEGDALLGGPPVQPERLPVPAHQLHLLVRADPGQGAGVAGAQHEAGVARVLAGRL